MKIGDFLLGAGAGFLLYHVYRKSSERAGSKPLSIEEKARIAAEVINDESQKYSDILKQQYDIIMPSDQVSKKVREKANEITRSRYEINLQKIKEPFNL
jgi:hypothetical protein